MAEEEMDVPVDDIIPFVDQSRERFEDEPLVNLAQNIKTHGLLQSGVAWYDAGRGKYVLICGERRWRASKLAGLPTMRLKVLAGTFRPGQMLALNLSENLQRETLGVVERGRAFRRLAQLENITGKQVAERMHVSDSTVSRDMAILDLPEPVIAEIAAGRVPASVGYELTKLCNDPDGQLSLAEAVICGRMSRGQVAREVRSRVGVRKTRPTGSQLTCKLDGFSITLSGAEPLGWEGLLAALTRLQRKAKALCDEGKAVTDLARAFRAS